MIDPNSDLIWSVAMRGVLLAAMMCGGVGVAQAADLPMLRGGFTDGLTVSRPNWDGFYVGGQAGWGSIQSHLSSGLNSDLIAGVNAWRPPNIGYTWGSLGTANGSGGVVGAFGGYNSQWDDVVIGVEANYIHNGFHASSSSGASTFDPTTRQAVATTLSNGTVTVSDFGSVRFRGGYAIDCFLPYAFMGAGLGYQTVSRNVWASPPPLLAVPMSATRDKIVYGYSAGVGFDVLLVAGLFFRAEYEYQRVTADVESNINSLRAGLGYKF